MSSGKKPRRNCCCSVSGICFGCKQGFQCVWWVAPRLKFYPPPISLSFHFYFPLSVSNFSLSHFSIFFGSVFYVSVSVFHFIFSTSLFSTLLFSSFLFSISLFSTYFSFSASLFSTFLFYISLFSTIMFCSFSTWPISKSLLQILSFFLMSLLYLSTRL
jgi:hypothetical protein